MDTFYRVGNKYLWEEQIFLDIRFSAIALATINYCRLSEDKVNSKEIAAYWTSITSLQFADIPFWDFTVLYNVSTGYPIKVDQSYFLKPFMDFLIPDASQHRQRSSPISFGLASSVMSAAGAKNAMCASPLRSSVIYTPFLSRETLLTHALAAST